MQEKKWPVLAQVLIGLGCLGGLRGILSGLFQQDWITGIFGLAALVIFWCFYRCLEKVER